MKAAGANRPDPDIQVNDLRHYVGLADPQLSPDGSTAALVVSRADYERNAYDTAIYLIDVHHGHPSQVPVQHPGASRPRWQSPGRLAYLCQSDDGTRQVFSQELTTGLEQQLTFHGRGIAAFECAPDGACLAYLATDPEDTIVSEHGAPIAHVLTNYAAVQSYGGGSWLDLTPPPRLHLWTLDFDGSTPRCWGIPDHGAHASGGLAWAPDSSRITFSCIAPDSAFTLQTVLGEVDLNRGSAISLGVVGFSPRYTAKDMCILFGHKEDPTRPATACCYDPATRAVHRVAPDLDRWHLGRPWPPEPDRYLVAGPNEDRYAFWAVRSGRAERLELRDVDASQATAASADGTVVFVGTSPARPQELYQLQPGAERPVWLTNFNAIMATRRYGHVESATWTSRDSTEAGGIIRFPPDFDSRQQYPLVVYPHGGPHNASTRGETGSGMVPGALAARGWIVLLPNYRGSNNCGALFQAGLNNGPAGAANDIMTGVDMLLQRGYVDGSRIALAGASYGGFLVAWLLAHDTRWAGAVVANASLDLVDQYALSDANRIFAFRNGGSPWREDNYRTYVERSPITHAGRIRTPTLIITTARDKRVPVASSFKLWRALQDNGVESELVVYDLPGHGPGDPKHLADYFERWLDWIAQCFS